MINGKEHEIDAELMGTLARVLTDMRREVIQDEQNPLAGILLANPLKERTDVLLGLVFWERENALTVDRVAADRWFIEFHQRSFDMRIINVPETMRIVERLWVGGITKPNNCSAICAHIIVKNPAFLVVTPPSIMWLLSSLVERVVDAFFEDFIGVLRTRRPFWPDFAYDKPISRMNVPR